MKQLIFNIGLIAIGSRILGLGRDLTLSYYFGATAITDIFLISSIIPSIIFDFVGNGIISSFIPIYNEVSSKFSEKESYNFLTNVINVCFVLCTIICVFILFFTSDIVKIFAKGFEGQVLKTTILYTKICTGSIYITITTSLLSAMLQTKDKFYFVAISDLVLKILNIVGNFIAFKYGNIYFPIWIVIARLIQLLFLFYPVYKMKYRYSFLLNFKDKYLKKLILLSLPIIISTGLEQINYLIDKTLATSVYKSGGVTILTYANRLNMAIIGIVIFSITKVFFPKITSFFSRNRNSEAKDLIKNTLSFVIIFGIFVTMEFIFFSNEIIEIIFKRGSFTLKDVRITSICFSYYGISFFAIAIKEIVLKILYALKDTKTALYFSSFGIFLNICLNLFLSKYLKLPGIALATSISIIVTTILLLNSLRKYNLFSYKMFLKILVKCSVSALVVFYLQSLIIQKINLENLTLKVLINGCVGIILYMIFISLLKIELVEEMIKTLKLKMRRGI